MLKYFKYCIIYVNNQRSNTIINHFIQSNSSIKIVQHKRSTTNIKTKYTVLMNLTFRKINKNQFTIVDIYLLEIKENYLHLY